MLLNHWEVELGGEGLLFIYPESLYGPLSLFLALLCWDLLYAIVSFLP